MTGDEIRLIQLNEIRRTDWLRTKSQMRHCHRAGFLRVVIEVALGEVISLFTDDLDRVLVRADCSICTQTEEHATHNTFRFDHEGWIKIEAGVGNIVVDANGKV